MVGKKAGKTLFPRTVENTSISREILGNKVQLHIKVLHTQSKSNL